MNTQTPTPPEETAAAENPRLSLLVVDDEDNILKAISRLVRSRTSLACHTASSGEQALALMDSQKIDIVISDERMPGMRGADLMAAIRQKHPDTARIMITGYADTQAILKAVNTGELFRFLKKPWDNEEILEVINSAAEHLRISRENARLQEELAGRNRELEYMNANLARLVEERTERLRESYTRLKNAHSLVTRQSRSTMELILSVLHNSKPFLAIRASRAAGLVTLFKGMEGLSDADYEKCRNTSMIHTAGGLNSEIQETSSWRDIARLSSNLLMGFYRLDEYAACLTRAASERKGKEDGIVEQIVRLVLDFDELVRGEELKPQAGEGQGPLKIAMDQTAARGESLADRQVLEFFFRRLEQRFQAQSSQIRQLEAGALQPGMRLARSILLQNGAMILPEGTVLTDEHIEHLKAIARFIRENIAVLGNN